MRLIRKGMEKLLKGIGWFFLVLCPSLGMVLFTQEPSIWALVVILLFAAAGAAVWWLTRVLAGWIAVKEAPAQPQEQPAVDLEPPVSVKPEQTAQPSVWLEAAGKTYASEQELLHETTETSHLYRDRYGRRVIAVRERFPCFDSYDFLYEDRYFRWYFIEEKQRWTMVYLCDERDSETRIESGPTLEEAITSAKMTPMMKEAVRKAAQTL